MYQYDVPYIIIRLIELDSSVNKNRKFQTGKHAKQQVAELNRRQQNLPPSVATGEADSIMAEYREKRGPSLMDAHADKKAKGPGREKGRKAFDRDMVSKNRILHILKSIENYVLKDL